MLSSSPTISGTILFVRFSLRPALSALSPPHRLKGFFSGGEDPLSNVSAGTELHATAESAGASARYHAQDGRHPGEAISCGLLAGVACVPCISKNGVQDFEVK